MKKSSLHRKRLWLLIVIAVELVACAVIGCSFLRKTDREKQAPVSQTETTVMTAGSPVVFEEPYPVEAETAEGLPPGPAGEKPVADGRKLPKVAIIIDDMGYHPKVGRELLSMDLDLTFSFLPHAPFTTEQEEQAYLAGRDILLHQPLEPRDAKWDVGPGALFLTTEPDRLPAIVERNLQAVPHAIGVNNHMGSKYTEHPDHMRQLLAFVKKKDLFFIDSFTTAASTGMTEAAKLGIKTARRHVFLDNVHDPGKICLKLEQLVQRAREHGYAIGIGHPNRETLTALTRCREKLLQQVRVIGVHELVK